LLIQGASHLQITERLEEQVSLKKEFPNVLALMYYETRYVQKLKRIAERENAFKVETCCNFEILHK